MQNRNQEAVLKQLHQYFITQNVTEEFVPLLLKKGRCSGFSICRAAMRYLGKLEWWEACLDRVLAWDGKVESLQNDFVLPGANDGKPVSLQMIFKRVAHYIIFNQTGAPYYDVEQDTFLLPGGLFILQQSSDDILQIKSNYRMSGNFIISDIVESLKDEATIQAIKKNICLVHNIGHVCELGLVEGRWVFYDPNYLDGKKKVFNSLEEVVKEIVNVSGLTICIELACISDPEVKPFSYYDTLLDQHPERLIQNGGLYIISKYNTHLVPRLLKDFKNDDNTCLIQWACPKGWTALQYAARRGHVEAVRTLCAAGAKIDHISNDDWSALLLAAMYGHTGAVQTLCAAGAKIDHASNDGWTALLLAARNGHTEAVRALCDAGAKVNKADTEGWTPLMLAARHGDVDAVVVLLSQGAHSNQRHSRGATAIMLAAQDGHIEVINQLLPHADLTLTLSASVSILLDFAAGQGRRQQVETLFKNLYGDDLPQRVPGYTALHLAVFFGHAQSVTVLLNKMTELTIETVDQLCQYATAMNYVEIHTVLASQIDALNKKELTVQAGCTLFNNKSEPVDFAISESLNRVVIK